MPGGIMKNWRNILLLVIFLVCLILTGCSSGGSGQTGAVVYSFPNEEAANSYILADGGEAAVIDPSLPDKIFAAIREKKLTPRYILLTHGHFDHIGGIKQIVSEFPGIKVYISPKDSDKLGDPDKNLSTMFGTEVSVSVSSEQLTEQTALSLGGTNLQVIATPGHTPGSVCLKAGNLLFSGDTLFKGSVGRTDFPDGSIDQLNESLKKLTGLPDDTKILPGHGEETTIGAEKGTGVGN